MNKELSKKIKIIASVLILLIVFLHGYQISPNIAERSWVSVANSFIQNLVSQEIARIAVPLFFMISGYLFFVGVHGSVDWYVAKWRRRVKSLLIPYLLWSIIGFFIYYLLQSVPFVEHYFTHKFVRDYSLQEALCALLWEPIPYQFWFIRDLMIYTLLTPVIHILSAKSKSISLLCIGVIWFFGIHCPYINLVFLSFYWAGCFLSIHHINISIFRYKGFFRFIAVVWLAFACIGSYTQMAQVNTVGYFHHVTILIGICALWYNYDILEIFFLKDRAFQLTSLSFFIFAFHEPMLTILKKSTQPLINLSEFFSIVRYLLCPVLAILLSIGAACVMKKYFQKLYEVLTGGR